MNTPAQIRAGRVLLGWDQYELAHAAGVARSTIERMERLGPEHCASTNVAKVRQALEAAGILFIKSGLVGAGLRLSRSREFVNDLIRIGSRGTEDGNLKMAAKAHLEDFVVETKRFFKGDVNEDEQVRAKLNDLRAMLEYEMKRRNGDHIAGLCRYVRIILAELQNGG